MLRGGVVGHRGVVVYVVVVVLIVVVEYFVGVGVKYFVGFENFVVVTVCTCSFYLRP